MTDPMKQAARVRDLFLAEQAKMPVVDANGVPIPPADATDPKTQMEQARAKGDWKTVLSIIHSQMTQPQPPDAA